MRFYVGIHQPGHARHLARVFLSVNRVRSRKAPVVSSDWILDSGAFRELERWGAYRHGPEEYAATVNRLASVNPGLTAAVSQDYMCESFMLEKTGLSIADHQRLTIERYTILRGLMRVYCLPVLQGYSLESYLSHIDQYGEQLSADAYVGVGSLCKRNRNMREIEAILVAIKRARPAWRLHGFGLKITALQSARVRDCLYSADSMAWSFAARFEGRGRNDVAEAVKFAARIERMAVQLSLPIP